MNAELMKKLADCIREVFPEAGAMQIDQETILGDVPGWDSMAAVNFQIQVEEAFGVAVPLEMLSDETSIDDVLTQIHNG